MTEEHKSFFGKVKDFFSAKPKTEEVSPQENQTPLQAPVIPTQRKVKYEECFWCKAEIFEDEKFSNQQGRHFHRNCYKLFLQAGRRGKI